MTVGAKQDHPCFHCGEPIPQGLKLKADISGQQQPVCCHGCLAVAELIHGAGLDRFYQFRDGHSARPQETALQRWQAWDRQLLMDQVSHRLDDQRRELLITVENIHCAACSWLIEGLLGSMPGVEQVQVNAATASLRLIWEPERTPLSALFVRLSQAGYLPQPRSEHSGARQRERSAALKRLGVAGLGMMQVMMYAVALYAGAFQGIDPGIESFLRYVSLAIATPVVLYSGAPFFRGAWRDLKTLRLGMDVPVALAIGAAYIASVYNTLGGGGEVFFDSATMFVFFLSVARYLEMHARHRSQSVADGVAGALPDLAERLPRMNGSTGGDSQSEQVTPAELLVGDRVRLNPGDAIPADGVVESGQGSLNESLLTGESTAVAKSPGASVRAGSTLLGGTLIMRVTASGNQTLLAQMGRLLERARSERPPLAATADRVAHWFVSAVLLIATVVAVVWYQIDPSRSFEVVLATLVVTCPCALSLATPAALAAATTGLARAGVLIVSGRALESLARVSLMVLDKTGTLTEPQLRLSEVRPVGPMSQDQYLRLAATLEQTSRHPLAQAFAHIPPLNAQSGNSEPAQFCDASGMQGTIQGELWRLGKPDWVGQLSNCAVPIPDDRREESWLALGNQDGLHCWFAISGHLRPDAIATLTALNDQGLELEIASGDADSAVKSVANAVGVASYQASMTPEDKLAHIKAIQSQQHKVVMVGDGINDAPVFGAADVAVAMGNAAALTRTGADLVLLGRSLAPLAWVHRHARRCAQIIRQNLTWAVLYNAVAVPLAAAGWVAPWMAAAGMSLSSLLVVANAIRLQRVMEQPARSAG